MYLVFRRNLAAFHRDQSGVVGLALAAGLVIAGMAALSVYLSVTTGQRKLDLVKSVSGGQAQAVPAILDYYLRQYTSTATVGTLPCPDSKTAPDGTADSTCTTVSRGVIPWVTLGMSKDQAVDGYGNYYTYVVNTGHLNICNTVTNSFNSAKENTGTLDATGVSLATYSASSPGSVSYTGTVVPFAVIAHGANGLGARTSTGTFSGTPSSRGELDNCHADAGTPCTVSDSNTVVTGNSAGSTGSTAFDDQVSYPETTALKKICERLTPGGALNAYLTENFDSGSSTIDSTKFSTSGASKVLDTDATRDPNKNNYVAQITTGGYIATAAPSFSSTGYNFDPTIRPLYVEATWTPDTTGAGSAGLSIVTRATTVTTSDVVDTSHAITFRFNSACSTSCTEGTGKTPAILKNSTSVGTAVGSYTLTAGKQYLIQAYDDGSSVWARITQTDDASNTARVYATTQTTIMTGDNRVAFVNGSTATTYIDNISVGVAELALETDGVQGYVVNNQTTSSDGTTTGNLTLEAWIKPRSVLKGLNVDTTTIAGNGTTAVVNTTYRVTASSSFTVTLPDPTAAGQIVQFVQTNSGSTINTVTYHLQTGVTYNGAATDPTGKGTAVLQFYSTAAHTWISGVPQVIASKWDSGSASTSSFRLYLDSTGALAFQGANNSTTATYAIGFRPTYDAWQHIAITYNGSSSTLNFYQDGELAGTFSGTLGTLNSGSVKFTVGSDNSGTTQTYFNGAISDVQVWDGVCLATQIVNYQTRLAYTGTPTCGTSPTNGNLVVNWRLDRESGGITATAATAYPISSTKDGAFSASSTITSLASAYYVPMLGLHYRPFAGTVGSTTGICPSNVAGAYQCDYRSATSTGTTLSIPSTLYAVHVKSWGAGGGGYSPGPSNGGAGGFSSGLVTQVYNGTTLTAISNLTINVAAATGGTASTSGDAGSGGGGASGIGYVPVSTAYPGVVAGGGGGAAYSDDDDAPVCDTLFGLDTQCGLGGGGGGATATTSRANDGGVSTCGGRGGDDTTWTGNPPTNGNGSACPDGGTSTTPTNAGASGGGTAGGASDLGGGGSGYTANHSCSNGAGGGGGGQKNQAGAQGGGGAGGYDDGNGNGNGGCNGHNGNNGNGNGNGNPPQPETHGYGGGGGSGYPSTSCTSGCAVYLARGVAGVVGYRVSPSGGSHDIDYLPSYSTLLSGYTVDTTTHTGNFTAVSGYVYTVSGSFTVTLPSGSSGNTIYFRQVGTSAMTYSPANGQKIEGSTSSISLTGSSSQPSFLFALTYNTTNGWQFTTLPGQGGDGYTGSAGGNGMVVLRW